MTAISERTAYLILLSAVAAAAIEPGLPSKTSVYAAIGRAVGAKHPDPELRNPDYLAIKFLGARERAILTDFPVDALDLDFHEAAKRLPNPDFVTNQLARTRFFDEKLLEALEDGARQTVILGAGFDSRGCRFQKQLQRVRFFEVDYGPTQEYKKQRVTQILGRLPKHVRYVPVDFIKDNLLTQLRNAGYSDIEKTLFIWEGVVFYLPESAVRDTLRFVRDHSRSGSIVAFNYALSSNPMVNNPDSRFSRWGEPIIFGFPGTSATDFVRAEGLEVVFDMPNNDLVRKYASRKDGSSPLRPFLDAAQGGFCVARVRGAHKSP